MAAALRAKARARARGGASHDPHRHARNALPPPCAACLAQTARPHSAHSIRPAAPRAARPRRSAERPAARNSCTASRPPDHGGVEPAVIDDVVHVPVNVVVHPARADGTKYAVGTARRRCRPCGRRRRKGLGHGRRFCQKGPAAQRIGFF